MEKIPPYGSEGHLCRETGAPNTYYSKSMIELEFEIGSSEVWTKRINQRNALESYVLSESSIT